jgi:ferredoxin
MDLERIERVEDAELPGGNGRGPSAEDGRPTVAWSWDAATGGGLPVEPARIDAAASAPDAARNLRELLGFHAYGRLPATADAHAGDGSSPALLYPYRDLSRARYAYPVCVDGTDAAAPARSLTEIVDRALAEFAGADDTGEQHRRNVHRLEAIVRSMVEDHDGERLTVLWDRAAARLFEAQPAPADKASILRESVAASRKALASDGELIACSPHTPLRLLRASLDACWREQSAPWREDAGALIRGLQDILSADFSQSEAARTPEQLRDSLGTTGDDVDFQAMSSILASRAHASALSNERRSRLETLLATLKRMQPAFGPGADATPAPFRHDAIFDDCRSAVAEYERRMGLLTEFFRAVRVARLEIQNQYRDSVHDAFFAGFDRRQLTDEELALCPPVPVRVTDETLTRSGAGDLLQGLQAGAPLKILLQLGHVLDADRAAVAWPARLAAMAAALQNVFVLQAPVSRFAVLRAGLLDGVRCAGPALFSVYAPAADTGGGLPAYLVAAAAAESRVFPVFAFDPSRGETHAERADVTDNTRVEEDWPVERLAYRSAAGQDAAMEIGFTPADFLYVHAPARDQFWAVPVERWNESMVPFHEYLAMGAEQAAGRVPYLSVVDRDGALTRVVTTRAVARFAREVRTFWRGVQEWGGVHNSYAQRRLAAEREKLQQEKEREVEAVEKNYLTQLDQDVSELTKAIVQRIAGQLLGVEGVASLQRPAGPAPAARAASPAAAAPAAAPVPAESPAPDEEEEEAVSFDDAYIDTPLCTSCNECTQLNGRIFGYNGNKQAEVKDAGAGPFSDLVRAAELCPVHIIHPGKPKNPGEPGLDELIQRAQRFN